jgi:oligopeptidase B
VLLKTNMDAGHGGASGRFEHLKDPALAYAFAIWSIGDEGSTDEAETRSPGGS